MPASSRVLVIGHPQPKQLHFGAYCVETYQEAIKICEQSQPSLLVFGHQTNFDSICYELQKVSPESRWILATHQLQPHQLIHWINKGVISETIEHLESAQLEKSVRSALEKIDQKRQHDQLVQLFTDQSKNLQLLFGELEQRVQKRQRQLQKSQKQLAETNAQMELVHKVLLGVYKAKSLVELERSLNETLNPALRLEWARVLFAQQSSILSLAKKNVLSIEIPIQTPAKFVLSKKGGKPFSAKESDLLFEVSEAIGLALQRIQKMDQAEILKQQWEATFDAISHPLCITTAQFKILKMNRAYALAAKKKYAELLNKNCFDSLTGTTQSFNPAMPVRARLGHYEIVGQPLPFDLDEKRAHLILFRDITEENRLERRILESTKLAELGTIGSSIAHELNNPLGGMLSFLQLIKMDLEKNSPLRPDIEDMERSTLKCRDIIRNLLSFTRKSDTDDFVETDLKEILERAIKLIELQTKSKGIKVDISLASQQFPIRASINTLSQAICNLLQNSIDSILERLQNEPLFPGQIKVKVENAHDTKQKEYQIQIIDNGIGIKSEHFSQIFNPLFTTRDPSLFSGMGLTTAHSIISEHGGRLEISSQSGSGTTAIISLTRPDF